MMMSSRLHAPATFLPEKDSVVSSGGEVCGGNINFFLLPGIEPRFLVQFVA
jgi:hypothetical protein